MELGEPPRDGVARELEEETGLTADPDDLTYVMAEAGEPAPDQHMVGIDYAIHHANTTSTTSQPPHSTTTWNLHTDNQTPPPPNRQRKPAEI
jgi:ADP-ribose pyrophosphatase YjhB (NUDIX family)